MIRNTDIACIYKYHRHTNLVKYCKEKKWFHIIMAKTSIYLAQGKQKNENSVCNSCRLRHHDSIQTEWKLLTKLYSKCLVG